ncbi:hypothetical protein D3C87_2085010 [compost metagenome]
MQRPECALQSAWRQSDLPMVTFEAERLSSTVAPASAAKDEGGIGVQTSSQISIWTVRSGMSEAVSRMSVPKGTSWPQSSI